MRSAVRRRGTSLAAVVAVLVLSSCTAGNSAGDPSTAVPTAGQDAVGPPSAGELARAESAPVEDPYYPDMSNPEVDALHYGLDLDWDGSMLTGRTTLLFRAATTTKTVRLDLGSALDASTVTLDGHDVTFDQADDGLLMQTGRLAEDTEHTLVIDYSGTPEPTPAPSLRADMAGGLGWTVDPDGSVHSFQEPYGAFTWYPVNDHPSDKALYDAEITTPAGSTAVFNGELVSAESNDAASTARWHLDEPAASYLITIAIGDYTEHTQQVAGGQEISYWLMSQDEDLLPVLERDGAEAFSWLEEHAGEYPFDSLGFVIVGGGSAMETQTMVTMSRGAVGRPDAVLQHELSHQWYGDTVTPVDWQGVWLNEGWAMYMQQWFEADTGRMPFAGGIDAWRRFDLKSRRLSGPPGDYAPGTFGDVNVYLGPAMMLEEIRQRVGDREFARLVRAWPSEHANANVDRADFEQFLEQQTGESFDALINDWLDSARTPRIR